jgi:hypothetical protein
MGKLQKFLANLIGVEVIPSQSSQVQEPGTHAIYESGTPLIIESGQIIPVDIQRIGGEEIRPGTLHD